MSNSKQFLDDFVKLEMYLKKYLNNPKVGFVQMVHMAAKTQATIKRHSNDLIEFAQLRNAIVHNRIGEDEAIAEPHDRVVAIMDRIVEQVTEPKRVRHFCKDKPVYYAAPHDNLATVLLHQQKYNYSVVPIYDGQHYVGMLHYRLYQRLLERYAYKNLKLDEMLVEDVLEFYEKDDRVMFFSENTELDIIVDRIMQLSEKGRTIIAIIVSKSGHLNDVPVGIITMADLPRIIRELE